MEISFFSGPQEGKFVLRGECPHCRSNAAFLPVTDSFHDESPSVDRWVAGLQCAACREFILGIVGFSGSVGMRRTLECLESYPVGKPNQITNDDIPLPILADFNEALRCRWVGAYNATAEMCRRALQSSCLQLGADPELKLQAQIDWLASPDGKGRITTPLKDMAHKVRLGGNRGAHPPDDPLEDFQLESEDADALIEFTMRYFESVYVTPANLAKFDFSRVALKKLKP